MTQLRIAFGILGSFPQVWVDTLKVRLHFRGGKRLAEAVPATCQKHVADNITIVRLGGHSEADEAAWQC